MNLTQQTKLVLEWPQFLDLFSRFVSSDAAKQKIALLSPVSDLSEQLALTREALLCAQKGFLPVFSPLEDVSGILKKTSIENHIAEGIDLFRIARLASLNNEI